MIDRERQPRPVGREPDDHVRGGMRDVMEWNEEMVRRYDIERFYERSHPLIRWVESRRLKAIVALARPAGHAASVLEVGCGAGHVLERFEQWRRTGVDLSVRMLQKTRRRLGGSVRLVQATADRLPFPDSCFDIVVCTEVLEHTADPGGVVCELARVVSVSGKVVVSIPNERNVDRAKRALNSIPGLRPILRNLAQTDNEWHLHRMDLASLRTLTRGVARIERVRAVPYRLLPLRYVALLRCL